MSSLIDIDGSTLEGGGQILRIALTLSCLKKLPVRIFNIRAGRSKSGLLEQHLKGVELMRDLSNGKVTRANIGSTEISFFPGDIKGGVFTSFIKTAGSISLVLQVALPYAIFSQSEVTLRLHGGTNGEMAPQIDYMTEVFRSVLEKFGATFDFELVRRGYFPKGGGEVLVKIPPVNQLHGINLTQPGKVLHIKGWSFVAGTLPVHLANQMANSAKNILRQVCNRVTIESYKEDRHIAPDNASGIILVAYTDTNCILGSSALGNRKQNAEETGKKAATDLLKYIETEVCADEHCQDQIIILMAIAKGSSRVKVGEITLHTKTAMFVVEKLTNVKFNVEPLESGGNIIECSGS